MPGFFLSFAKSFTSSVLVFLYIAEMNNNNNATLFSVMRARRGYKAKSSCPRQIFYEVEKPKKAVTFAVDCFVRIACFCFHLF